MRENIYQRWPLLRFPAGLPTHFNEHNKINGRDVKALPTGRQTTKLNYAS